MNPLTFVGSAADADLGLAWTAWFWLRVVVLFFPFFLRALSLFT